MDKNNRHHPRNYARIVRHSWLGISGRTKLVARAFRNYVNEVFRTGTTRENKSRHDLEIGKSHALEDKVRRSSSLPARARNWKLGGPEGRSQIGLKRTTLVLQNENAWASRTCRPFGRTDLVAQQRSDRPGVKQFLSSNSNRVTRSRLYRNFRMRIVTRASKCPVRHHSIGGALEKPKFSVCI